MTENIYSVFDDGWRLMVLVSKGSKHATFLNYGTLRAYKMPAREMRFAAPVDGIPPRRMIGSINRRLKMYKRDNVTFTKSAVKKALEVLRA